MLGFLLFTHFFLKMIMVMLYPCKWINFTSIMQYCFLKLVLVYIVLVTDYILE